MADSINLPLDELEEDDENPRKDRDQDADDDLRMSLAADGQLNDVLIANMPTPTQKGRVVAGNRRLRLAGELGWKELRCRLIEGDELTIKKVKLIDNLHRTDPHDMGHALYATGLAKEYGWTQKRLARELSLDQGVVSRWFTTVTKLNPDLYASGLSSRILYLLASKVKNQAEQVTLANRVKDEGLTVDQLTSLLNGKKPKTTKRTTFKVGKGIKVIVDGVGNVADALAEALAQTKRV